MIQVTKTAQFHEKMLAMNEALMLGSLRQHELTEASDSLNVQLQREITERKTGRGSVARKRRTVSLLIRAGSRGRLFL